MPHLEQADCQGESHSSGAEGPVGLLDGPGVRLNVSYHIRQVHVNGCQRLQEPGGKVGDGGSGGNGEAEERGCQARSVSRAGAW